MSRLEKTVWSDTAVPLAISGSVNIPEISNSPPPLTDSLHQDDSVCLDDHLSPTLSVDSGRSTSTELWPSHKYLVYGGPGFSIAALDSSLGSVSQIPVPVPLPSPQSEAPPMGFSLSAITALNIVGECQVWAGTEEGSLHVLELTPDLSFHGHSLTNLPDMITCIQSHHQVTSSPGRRSKVDVLVGCSNGNLTILSGQTNERKGLKNSVKCTRKVVQLGNENESVSCMSFVMCDGVEVCWCGCGASVVILRCSDWKELGRFDAHSDSPPEELVSTVEVSALFSTELGVWSTLSSSSALTLWDKHKLTPKISIVCWDSYSTAGWLLDSSAQISALSYSYPLLFAGTKGGHLMVFKISTNHAETKVAHRLIAGTHCSSAPVVNIHPTPLNLDAGFPSPATPTPAVNVLVICGDTCSSNGCAQLYELVSSPHQSPLTSPMSINGRISTHSTQSTPSTSLTLKRASISEYSSLPPLSLAGVALSSRSLLPLRTD